MESCLLKRTKKKYQIHFIKLTRDDLMTRRERERENQKAIDIFTFHCYVMGSSYESFCESHSCVVMLTYTITFTQHEQKFITLLRK